MFFKVRTYQFIIVVIIFSYNLNLTIKDESLLSWMV